MSYIRWFSGLVVLLIFGLGAWSAQAQEDSCAFDVSSVIQRVTEECANMEANTVCYGNRDVTATPRVNTIDFQFDTPGQRVALPRIQSLVVDATGSTAEEWGVAQMRLQVGSETGLQDVTMLLFGRFDVDNAVAPVTEVQLQVRSRQVQLYGTPNPTPDAIPLATVDAGSLLRAIGRLEDSSWIRVETLDTRIIGWLDNSSAASYTYVNEGDSIGILPVQEADDPYYGAMQAFYFQNGESDLGCETVTSDGLLIQTSEGQARISLLINEVSVELTSIQNEGLQESGTALVQANAESETGMQIDVVGGEARVETDDGVQDVGSGQRSSIPLQVDINELGDTIFRPNGAPAEASDIESLEDADFSTVIDAFTAQGTGDGNGGDGVSVDVPAGGGGGNNTSNNTGSTTTGNGGGLDVTINTNNGNEGSGNNGSGGTNGDTQVDTSNPFENPNPDLVTSDNNEDVSERQELNFPVEAIAITVVAISAVIGFFVLVVSIWNSLRTHTDD